MKLLFENWRGYLNESADPDVLNKIIEDIERVIEIPVNEIFKLNSINESDGINMNAQLVGVYTDLLMEMFQERWIQSSEYKSLQEMGYNINIIDMDTTIENNVSLTKNILSEDKK